MNGISIRRISVVTAVSLFYLLFSAFCIGFKTDQLVLVMLVNVLFYFNSYTRSLIAGFSIFVVYWVLFDYMKMIPNYKVNDVAIASLYHLEQRLFGIGWNGALLTPNEFFEHTQSVVADVASGFFYLLWVPLPLLLAVYFFNKDKTTFLHFSFTFLFVNILGFVIYYLVPAAPPWYVKLHGFDFIPGTPGNTAGLARFDQYFHVSVFASLYEKSSNVFAAVPSLHSAYPLIVLYYGIRSRMGWINILFAIVTIGIWFAAVYTGHHYVTDVLCGIATAGTGILLYNRVLWRTTWFKKIYALFYREVTYRPRTAA